MTPPTRRRTALALAATAVVAAGATACASGTPAASAGTPATKQVGTSVTTVQGATLTVPGTKPTALVFISIGCVDCSAAAKATAAAQAASGGKAAFLGVDLDTGVSAGDITSFLSQIGASGLPVTINNPGLATTYQVAALSTVLVLDKAGHVTYRAVAPSAGDIEAALAKAGA